jgi:chromosome segregation ATPase
MTENDLLEEIVRADGDRAMLKGKISKLQKQVTELESDLIAVTIHKDRVTDQLRQLRGSTVNHELTERELEIEAFKERLPGCLERIAAKDKADNLKK